MCARANRTTTLLLISSLVAGRLANPTSLHFTSPLLPGLLHIPTRRTAARRRVLRASRLPRLLTESTARQPRSNATGLATLIVSAPDNLCLVGQVQAVQPRPLSAIPVPVCLT